MTQFLAGFEIAVTTAIVGCRPIADYHRYRCALHGVAGKCDCVPRATRNAAVQAPVSSTRAVMMGYKVAIFGTIDVIRRDTIGMDLGCIVREGSIIRTDSRGHC